MLPVCTVWPPRTFVATVLAPIVSRDPATDVAVMSAARKLSIAAVSDQKAFTTEPEVNMPCQRKKPWGNQL